MDYHLKKQTLPQVRYVLDTAVEQAVDIDLTLPDYCPDIERILSCSLEPGIYMANVIGKVFGDGSNATALDSLGE